MNRQPTGTVSAAAAGRDLTITRTYRAPVDDVWAAITESERCGRWFATWTGDAFAGGAITLQMTAEGDDVPPATGHISACRPPTHLAVDVEDSIGRWSLDVRLHVDGDATVSTFVQHLEPGVNVGEVGPGWEYYWTAWSRRSATPSYPSSTTTSRPCSPSTTPRRCRRGGTLHLRRPVLRLPRGRRPTSPGLLGVAQFRRP